MDSLSDFLYLHSLNCHFMSFISGSFEKTSAEEDTPFCVDLMKACDSVQGYALFIGVDNGRSFK